MTKITFIGLDGHGDAGRIDVKGHHLLCTTEQDGERHADISQTDDGYFAFLVHGFGQSDIDEKDLKLRHRTSQKVATSCGNAELFLGGGK